MSQDLKNADDAQLLLLLGEGSKPAFDVLYNKYWKQVYNTAYKRLNDTERAQDIAQDVFVQLWTRGSKSPIDNLPAYLLVAARNGVFKYMEKEAKYAALPDGAEELESPLGRADANMLHDEFLKAFNELINTLPPQQQMIFNLRFNEGLSSQQIADQLQISPKTVRNQMGRALATLRKSLFLLHVLFYFYQKG
ncbi:RNA polymerase sigma factor [Mucilaginibacter sp. OK283]|jgi:RNA polymerase sigma-70 factor (ECF subfamily)|uniref:RNA polymerase sigma factor n=1 Tax=Mucilaginibacter sp. OK283 TaxID=1881049 RepID=UPI0008C7550F|nr:RNA polymerase sigma-70 factor [Mucilaginibacter sp. OK283]SEP41511.1 RNA polymerase sigma-70 factor, ECF subfamily [Mucilaginibacter sp. OK283]